VAAYRRQQELAWVEQLVEDIETALEATGGLGRPGRVPAICFLDLVGYIRLTEEHGDQAAAELAEALAVLVDRSAREHGGVPVKWLGDGVMVHHREPAGAVLSALGLVDQLPEAGLPPAHVGVAAGPVVVQGGDYLRTPPNSDEQPPSTHVVRTGQYPTMPNQESRANRPPRPIAWPRSCRTSTVRSTGTRAPTPTIRSDCYGISSKPRYTRTGSPAASTGGSRVTVSLWIVSVARLPPPSSSTQILSPPFRVGALGDANVEL
jgi:hypothetical protein